MSKSVMLPHGFVSARASLPRRFRQDHVESRVAPSNDIHEPCSRLQYDI